MLDLPCYIAGKPVRKPATLTVRSPYAREAVGTVPVLEPADLDQAVEAALRGGPRPTRFERSQVLERAASILAARRDEIARLNSSESGLCLRDTRYEMDRALDVLHFAALEALRDDGQVLSCDVSAQGKARKIFTLREPHTLVAAITPFNHPLNQVLHKVAPAIAAGAPVILKPSEKTPLTAIRAVEILYEAGLPGHLLSVVTGEVPRVAEFLVQDPRVEVLSFTGSVEIGKRIAQTAGYKKLVLELGGNCPLLVCADANLDLAAKLAAEGSFRNSGQRCTAVNRILVDEAVIEPFTEKLVALAREYRTGDPMEPGTRVGSVITEASARRLEALVASAAARGARVLLGGTREGAVFEPTVLGDVPRDCDVVACEAFGPIASIVRVGGLDDAIEQANATPYGLSSGVVTESLTSALRAVQGIRAGTVNVNEVPGYRLETSPFGGVKDSGLGVKEGVVEAVRAMTWVKTFSLPW
ncbi:MAG TPA: aldehyde dehydrogenase family protein [Planctomycetota bacterium]|jgi:putative phosphonoacetaldehyde dehydrogenase|nr:aldehyde dehydrogenase family protein [Planctomycetota bacterium]